MKYPLKKDAVFTDENDHNPLIQKVCPECNGYGKRDKYTENDKETGMGAWTLSACPTCKGHKAVDGTQHYFDNDQPAMVAELDESKWFRCPNCNKRVASYDKHNWTGKRHMKCGQKIILKEKGN